MTSYTVAARLEELWRRNGGVDVEEVLRRGSREYTADNDVKMKNNPDLPEGILVAVSVNQWFIPRLVGNWSLCHYELSCLHPGKLSTFPFFGCFRSPQSISNVRSRLPE